MKKTDLLADIQSKALKIVSTVEEPDAVKNAVNVKSYITHVMEQDGNSVRGRNIGWYTIDEGTDQEQAFYRDQVVSKSVARELVITYMKTLSPAPYIRFAIEKVDEENRYAYVNVIKNNGNNTATEMRVLVYKNGTNPIAHIELTK